MAKELTNRLSDGLQCGSRWRGDFKVSLPFKSLFQSSFHPQPQPLPNYVKTKNKITRGKTSEITTQILIAQSWKCFYFSSLCEQMSVFSSAAVCQRQVTWKSSALQILSPATCPQILRHSIQGQYHFNSILDSR